MKKILIVIFAALLLVGCAGTSDEELNSFIESFNENRRKTVERIEPANIGEG